MTKVEFMTDLRKKLSGLSQDDVEDRLAFYNEMIDDYVEHGMPEAEAVARIGSPDEIVAQVMSEIPLTKIVKEKMKPKTEPKSSGTGGRIALIILLFPIWFPLLITAFALLLSFYVVLWAMEISLFAVALAFAAILFCGLLGGIYYFIQGNPGAGCFVMGGGIIGAGFSLITFFFCTLVAKGIIAMTKGFFSWVKSLFIGKEGQYA